MVKNSVIALILLLIAPVVVLAQVFTNDDYGYSIEIDDSYQLTRDDHATHFRSEENEGVVMIKNWPGLDEETAKSYLQQGFQNARIAIVPGGEPEAVNIDDGKGFQTDIQGVIERQLMKGTAASFVGNNGQGMVVVVAGPSDAWETLAPSAEKIITSIKLIDFKVGPDARDWYYMLAGTRLSLRGTSTNRSKRDDIYFCSDGSFRHRMSSSAIKDFDSGSTFGFSGRTKLGDWWVVDEDGESRLVMRYSNGSERSAIIEDRSGQTYLDGQRFYMMRNSRCR